MTLSAAPGGLTVVMPVHNAGPYLEASIRSILGQSYGDFEFAIRDDGSDDGSTEILREWAARDRRITLCIGDRCLGPAGSSNSVVRQSNTAFVARMDADDISHPDRLRRQLAVLRSQPDTVLVGSLWEGIDARGKLVRPRDRSRLSGSSPFSPFPHGSTMFRRAAFDLAGGYRTQCDFWEDTDLYIRLAAHGRILVLPDPLYLHRASPLSTRLVSSPDAVEHAVDTMYRTFEGRSPSPTASCSLEEPKPSGAKLLPRVFVALAATTLWSGGRPAVLKRICRHGALRFDAASLFALSWAMWAWLSPGSLRSAQRCWIRARDFAVRGKYHDGVGYPWVPAFAERSVNLGRWFGHLGNGGRAKARILSDPGMDAEAGPPCAAAAPPEECRAPI
jgi:hypothetical protein